MENAISNIAQAFDYLAYAIDPEWDLIVVRYGVDNKSDLPPIAEDGWLVERLRHSYLRFINEGMMHED